MSNREKGYYHVLPPNEGHFWEIAYWNGEAWLFVGDTEQVPEEFLWEIDEHKIIKE